MFLTKSLYTSVFKHINQQSKTSHFQPSNEPLQASRSLSSSEKKRRKRNCRREEEPSKNLILSLENLGWIMVEVNQSQARSGSRFAIEPSWRKKSFTCDVTFGPQNPATLTADCETYALFPVFLIDQWCCYMQE